jgi:4a-hydroxytetrahydrobiopterin dehydratase
MDGTPSRRQVSEAVTGEGWRVLLGTLSAAVPVRSPAHGAEVAAHVVAACGEDAGHLRVDLRPDRVVLALMAPDRTEVNARDVELAHRLSAALRDIGLRAEPGIGPPAQRPVQMLELAIDASDIAAVRPFWKAVLNYTDEAGAGPEDAIVDPLKQGPAIWFQRMDRPRPQRNRIHLDVCVPHDEAPRRLAAALAAGGRLLSDAEAPAFWVLADAEGNEACVTTWQGRDG